MENANCTNPEPCSPKRRYFSQHRSYTFEQTPNVDWGIRFSDKSKAKGWLHSDVVQVAGFVIDRQVLGMANTMVGFRDPGVDGILGLGMRSLATHGDATPVENLIYDMGMKSEVGIWLGSGKQGGELNFGGNDPARYKGSLSYFDLPDKVVYWAASVLSIAVEDAPPLHPPNKGSTASSLKQIDARTNPGAKQPSVIFDTASNLILLPPRIATKVHQYIHNSFFGLYTGYDIISGSYTVPCNLNKDVWIELGPTVASKSGDPSSNSNTDASRFKISGRDIVRERAGGISGLFNTCQSGIQASRSNDDDWVLGNIWFMNNYMILDHKHRQVGIAPAARPERS
ncbi:1,3-beta-glucanosyltransferase [Dissophora globulifera]|nr:1,3-beta-glucanosyltransferase [Dissophora globulifera]